MDKGEKKAINLQLIGLGQVVFVFGAYCYAPWPRPDASQWLASAREAQQGVRVASIP